MTSLCLTDQTPDQHYSIWEPAREGQFAAQDDLTTWGNLQSAPVKWPLNFKGTADPPASAWLSFDQQQTAVAHAEPLKIESHRPLSLAAQLARMRETGAELLRLDRRAERDARHRQALRWLSENREKFAGQWIALQGATLLAAGKNAKEVFSRVRGQEPPALVLKVETEDLPFGGW